MLILVLNTWHKISYLIDKYPKNKILVKKTTTQKNTVQETYIIGKRNGIA